MGAADASLSVLRFRPLQRANYQSFNAKRMRAERTASNSVPSIVP
jgi:hypothetical protein